MSTIAKKASQYIEDGDVVYINSSSTALMVIDYLKGKKVTVVTNNTKTVTHSPDSLVKVVLTGGEIGYTNDTMVGPYAISSLNGFEANKCIIGCAALNERGITTDHMSVMAMNQTMISRTSELKIVVCDYSKIGLEHKFRYSNLSDIDVIVTDSRVDKEILNKIKERFDSKKIVIVEPLGKIEN